MMSKIPCQDSNECCGSTLVLCWSATPTVLVHAVERRLLPLNWIQKIILKAAFSLNKLSDGRWRILNSHRRKFEGGFSQYFQNLKEARKKYTFEYSSEKIIIKKINADAVTYLICSTLKQIIGLIEIVPLSWARSTHRPRPGIRRC